jgi:hypothetical protein
MGCDCCKIAQPKHYEKCKVVNDIHFQGLYIAPCGMTFGARPGDVGSNYTPPKKKRKKRR